MFSLFSLSSAGQTHISPYKDLFLAGALASTFHRSIVLVECCVLCVVMSFDLGCGAFVLRLLIQFLCVDFWWVGACQLKLTP